MPTPVPTHTDAQIRTILLKVEAMMDMGKTLSEAADRLDLPPAKVRRWKKLEVQYFSIPGPWQLTHEGKTWRDMPGGDYICQRCNFSLFRRGKLHFNEVGDLVSGIPGQRHWRKRKGRPKKGAIVHLGTTEPEVDIEAFFEPSSENTDDKAKIDAFFRT